MLSRREPFVSERPLGHLLTILGRSARHVILLEQKEKQEMEKTGKWSIMSFCHKTSLLGIVESFLSVYLALLSLFLSLSRSLRPVGLTSVFVHIDAMQCNAITLSILLLLR